METPPMHAFRAKFGFLAKNSLKPSFVFNFEKKLKKTGKNKQKQLDREVLLK